MVDTTMVRSRFGVVAARSRSVGRCSLQAGDLSTACGWSGACSPNIRDANPQDEAEQRINLTMGLMKVNKGSTYQNEAERESLEFGSSHHDHTNMLL